MEGEKPGKNFAFELKKCEQIKIERAAPQKIHNDDVVMRGQNEGLVSLDL